MPIWKGTPVKRTPVIVMINWRLIKVYDKKGKYHGRKLVGYNLTECEGRLSSRVTRVDRMAMRCRTKSGRVYQLEGPPGTHPDAEYLLGHWLAATGARIKDVAITAPQRWEL